MTIDGASFDISIEIPFDNLHSKFQKWSLPKIEIVEKIILNSTEMS